jgi:hypothetical protein
MLRFWVILLIAGISALTPARAEQPTPTFKPAADGGYEFDTGVVRGRLKNQGLQPLVHVPTGTQLAGGALMSYYRLFSSGTRYGDRICQWPAVARLLPDGAVEMVWAPAKEHPVEITGVYRWRAAGTLDVETIVKPQIEMPRFEVFLASYAAADTLASVYVRPNDRGGGGPRLLAADVNPLVDGSYLMFPRDREAVRTIFDGRWERPPSPVRWSVTRWIAAPLAARRHPPSGAAILMMAPPEDCFAMAAPYNKTPADGVSNHASLYQSLFGQDLKAGQTAHAHSRLVVEQNPSDQRAVELYQEYLRERKE